MRLSNTPATAHLVFSNCVGPVELTDKDTVNRAVIVASASVRVVALVAVLAMVLGAGDRAGAAVGASGAAVRQSSRGCDDRAGTVWLENRLARVYAHRGRVYACRRASGRSIFLMPTGTSQSRGIRLAGRFVVWVQTTASGVQRIVRLDVRTRRIRRVGSLQTGGHMLGPGIAGFVVGTDGTVIWLDDVGSQEGPFSSFVSTLYENSGRFDVILDRNANDTPAFPISSFGLSSSGHVVVLDRRWSGQVRDPLVVVICEMVPWWR